MDHHYTIIWFVWQKSNHFHKTSKWLNSYVIGQA